MMSGKNKVFLSDLLQVVLFSGLIFLSFITFSARFFAGMNSDMALHVLMSDRFMSVHDLYYWGQNRLGSLLPLLAKPLTYLLSPLWAASIVQYLFIAGTCFWIFYWIRKPLWRFICLLFLLLPPDIWFYNLVIGHPYSAQTLLVISSFSFLCIPRNKPALSLLCLGLAVWVSELSIAAVPVWIYLFVQKNGITLSDFRTREFYRKYYRLIPVAAGLAWLLITAKAFATGDPDYISDPFANMGQIKENISRSVKSYAGMFKYHSDKPWNLVARCLSLFIPICFFYLSVIFTRKAKREMYPVSFAIVVYIWLCFFILSLSLYFYKSGSSDRYLSNIPFMALFAMCFYLQHYTTKIARVIAIVTLAGILISSASSFHRFRLEKYNNWNGLLEISTVKDFPVEKGSAIVGTYWNSYVFSAYHTRDVVTTSYWGDLIRDWPAFYAAMDGRPVYVIGKAWLEDFPDTIPMGPYQMIKTSEVKEFREARYAIYKGFKKADP